MIIRLTLSNILSFNEEQVFNLIPSSSTSLSDHVKRGKKRDDISSLKSSVIYGANASGKSNLIKAISFLKYITTNHLDNEASFPITKFKLGNAHEKDVSKLEIEFKNSINCYAYGIEFNSNTILEEWLYKINKRSEKKIFERKSSKKRSKNKNENKLKTSTKVTFDPSTFKNEDDAQFATFTGRGTPANKTFIKECKDRNVDFNKDINSAIDWFENKLKILFPKTKSKGLEFRLEEESIAQSMSNFLEYFQTGISELLTNEIDIDKDIPEHARNIVKELIAKMEPGNKGVLNSTDGKESYAIEKTEDGQIVCYQLYTKHKTNDGRNEIFEIKEESDGTRRIIDFLIPLIDMSNNDTVYLIDEIDRSLHPILSRGLIEYYFNATKNTNSQLIVTTHESNLLDLDLFRKDEIWFVEKNNNSSRLYSLIDFKPRSSKDIQKGYLNGRYGAIPFLTNPADLNWGDEDG